MSDSNQQASQQNQAPAQQTENAPQGRPTEISSLANYRAAREGRASSAQPQQRETDGQPQPNVGQERTQEQQREEYIPRQRFDEVLNQRNTLQQQLQQMQSITQQQPQNVVGPTGMVHPNQQPQLSAQQANEVQSFINSISKDKATSQQWNKRIANEGVSALAELVVKVVEERGQQMAAEYTRNIDARITPLQRQMVDQSVNTYAAQRQNDPAFAAARPVFDQLVQTAVQRNYDVTNPQTLATIEFLAKQQTQQQFGGMPQQQQMPQVTPFSERPGSGGQGFGKPQQRQLTPQEQQMAARFNMTNEQYLASLRSMGVE